MKKLWILNRAFHQDIADNLLEVFNEKTKTLNAWLEISAPGSLTLQQEIKVLAMEIESIQYGCTWHINEAHKYSALIAAEDQKLQAPASPSNTAA